MDQNRHLVLTEAIRLSRCGIEELLHALDFDEVIARAHRSQLVATTLPGAVGDRRGIAALEASLRLSSLDVVTALRNDTAAVMEDLRDVDPLPSLFADAGGHGTRD